MLWYTTANGKYRIESLSASTFPGALRVIKESLCQDEVVCVGTEVDKNPAAIEELLELSAEVALDGVSLVAVNNESEEVVAVAFNKIQVKSSATSKKPFFQIFAEERCTQDSSRALIQFMADVDKRCNLFDKYGVDCSFEMMFLATLENHRYKNLGFLLCTYSLKVASSYEKAISKLTVPDLGKKYSHITPREPVRDIPEICQAICTTIGSQKIMRTLNFTAHLTLPFSDFVYKGKTYAERYGRPGFFQVVAISLI